MRLLSICLVCQLHNRICCVFFSCKCPFSGPTSLASLKLEQDPVLLVSFTISSVAQILSCCVTRLPHSTLASRFCLLILLLSPLLTVLLKPPLPEPGHVAALPAVLLSRLRQSGAAEVSANQTSHSTGWMIVPLIRLVALRFWRVFFE